MPTAAMIVMVGMRSQDLSVFGTERRHRAVTIAPLETRYAGCRFRSRLEARWAVFFDNLGIRWEYERQGFELAPLTPAQVKLNEERGIFSAEGDANHLGYYLPDFWLPEQSAWLEIKGADPDDR